MRKIIGAAAFVAMVFKHYRHPLNQTIPTIIRTACKVQTTASRGCVSSQVTCSAKLRPGGHVRIVARILDLHTSGHRAADGLIRYSDRATCDARLDSLPA